MEIKNNLLKDYKWGEKCKYILERCKSKWEARKTRKDPIYPIFDESNKIDIKFLPNNFIALIKTFSAKCKYCGMRRVTPTHLNSFHQINIEKFSIEDVYQIWVKKRHEW